MLLIRQGGTDFTFEFNLLARSVLKIHGSDTPSRVNPTEVDRKTDQDYSEKVSNCCNLINYCNKVLKLKFVGTKVQTQPCVRIKQLQ
jgi:hypothetical protein